MTKQEVIWKVCDRIVNTLYNELDYYMFEELGYEETDDKYVEDADKLIIEIIKELNGRRKISLVCFCRGRGHFQPGEVE